ncbi:ice-binding family protein [Microbispora sp. NBC_01389]|uniref:ice-binding family protein n=1 Tax=Microbispora sp. NBC_01389 TaxID=2903584 RepID=UPI0032522F5A
MKGTRRPYLARDKVRPWLAAILVSMVTIGLFAATPQAANAASPPPVPLGTAANFAVLAGTTVTNTGATVVTGDLGVSPGSAVTGFPPGVVNGTIHAADATAAQAQTDLTAAYTDAAARPVDAVLPTDLGTIGTPVAPGVYASASGTFAITGNLTLDAQGDPNAVFIFKTASTLVTASASTVTLIGGAQACNVFWQVGSSATLGTGSSFVGNILALTSITVTTGVTVNGRTLARNGAVTLDTDTITRSVCTVPPVQTTTTTLTSSCTSGQSGPAVFTATVTASGGTVPTGEVVFRNGTTSLGTVALNSAGQAIASFPNLPQGQARITASYLGAPGLAASTSPVLIQDLGPNGTCPVAVIKKKKKVALQKAPQMEKKAREVTEATEATQATEIAKPIEVTKPIEATEPADAQNNAFDDRENHQVSDSGTFWNQVFHSSRKHDSTVLMVVTPHTSSERNLGGEKRGGRDRGLGASSPAHSRQPVKHMRPGGHH